MAVQPANKRVYGAVCPAESISPRGIKIFNSRSRLDHKSSAFKKKRKILMSLFTKSFVLIIRLADTYAHKTFMFLIDINCALVLLETKNFRVASGPSLYCAHKQAWDGGVRRLGLHTRNHLIVNTPDMAGNPADIQIPRL
jgi:hypothetical protein